jgi:acetyl-CoA carboxylase carboxyl transferase subunit beta
MGWFTKKKTPEPPPVVKTEEVWVQCPSCKAHVYKEEWDKGLKACPRCNFHDRLTAKERIDMTLDAGSFNELNAKVKAGDPLTFADAKGSYAEKAQETCQKTGLNESVVTGIGQINKIKVVIAVMDFRFFGGSLAGGTGEKILQAASYAFKGRIPYIIFSASGGARMQEGVVSLMQMAKTCAGVARLHQIGVPYISVLTDPTTGGVSASYAMMGDVNIAEPGALIGFAGRRVIEETIKQKLPDDFQKAEFLMAHGFLDMIVPRKEMKDTLARILRYAKH